MTAPKQTAREKRAEARVRRARAALEKLSSVERNALFREMGACACQSIAKVASKSPGVALGALFGAVIGAALTLEEKK